MYGGCVKGAEKGAEGMEKVLFDVLEVTESESFEGSNLVVSAGSMFMMGVVLIYSVLIPVVLAIILKKKYPQTSLKAFFIGCGTFFVFAGVLESIMHQIVLMFSPIGNTILGNTWLYALYGGLAAGVFEETGRLISMKFLLKKEYIISQNALMFGAGHGGFEALLILGTGMLNNLIYSVLINSGQTGMVLNSLPEDQQQAFQEVLETLIQSTPLTFLPGMLERIPAVALHMAFSVMVWIAVVKGKKLLYPLAVFLHFFVDGVLVVMQGYGVPTALIEICIFIEAAVVIWIAWRLWKANKPGQEGKQETNEPKPE